MTTAKPQPAWSAASAWRPRWRNTSPAAMAGASIAATPAGWSFPATPPACCRRAPDSTSSSPSTWACRRSSRRNWTPASPSSNPSRGAVVLMDPKTGEILAMASRPHFDLNHKQNIAENGFNYAIQAIYEPGSTFKIIATGGALNEGLVTPQTSVFCHNGFYQEGSDPGARPSSVRQPHTRGSAAEIQQHRCLQARPASSERSVFSTITERWASAARPASSSAARAPASARNTDNAVDFSRASLRLRAQRHPAADGLRLLRDRR